MYICTYCLFPDRYYSRQAIVNCIYIYRSPDECPSGGFGSASESFQSCFACLTPTNLRFRNHTLRDHWYRDSFCSHLRFISCCIVYLFKFFHDLPSYNFSTHSCLLLSFFHKAI
ncbi:hypothetical protein CLIB1423_21S01684 [[Candida] railenensis]|uniref:Uncharacterized protein n=1 Tax=[Candida] railenensis TaxID=45579 RepID=A0A9P0QU49_9ASCO|nr:hypothetical protein CLIB1423_21S01684 [[Candida] railenensis]